ncbi:MAG: energy transducer TonB [Acidobacteriota bacterium]
MEKPTHFRRIRGLLAATLLVLAVASAQTDEPVYQMGPGVTPPRVIQQVQPEHPAKGFRISGTVEIGLIVSSAGEPKDVRVVRSLEKDIDQSAVEAVQKWRFDPAKKDGKAVAVKVSVEIRFHDM